MLKMVSKFATITDLEQSKRSGQLFSQSWKMFRLFLKDEATQQSAALFWCQVVEYTVEQQFRHQQLVGTVANVKQASSK